MKEAEAGLGKTAVVETGGGGFMMFWLRLSIGEESKGLFGTILTDLYW